MKTLIAEAMGLSASQITISPRPALDYQSNQLYDAWADGRHLIIKEFLKQNEVDYAPVREFQALTLLAPLDIAPQPILFQPSTATFPKPIVVYEFMEGEMWDRYTPSVVEMRQLAETFLKINTVSLDTPWLSRGQDRTIHESVARLLRIRDAYLDWVQDSFPEGRKATDLCVNLENIYSPMAAELQQLAPILCFCSSDTRFANVIRRPDGRLGIIDWEDSGLRDPARDIAGILVHPNQEDLLSLDSWQAFLQPYLAERGKVDPSLQRRIDLYLMIFPVFWLVTILQIGMNKAKANQLAAWQVNGISANERLRRYMARILAWPDLDISDQRAKLEAVVFFPEE